jgi:hypothetical protein
MVNVYVVHNKFTMIRKKHSLYIDALLCYLSYMDVKIISKILSTQPVALLLGLSHIRVVFSTYTFKYFHTARYQCVVFLDTKNNTLIIANCGVRILNTSDCKTILRDVADCVLYATNRIPHKLKCALLLNRMLVGVFGMRYDYRYIGHSFGGVLSDCMFIHMRSAMRNTTQMMQTAQSTINKVVTSTTFENPGSFNVITKYFKPTKRDAHRVINVHNQPNIVNKWSNQFGISLTINKSNNVTYPILSALYDWVDFIYRHSIVSFILHFSPSSKGIRNRLDVL